MRITFRQGIITYPTSGPLQVFLAKTGVYVSFLATNGQTDIAFAHGSSDYLHTESVSVTNAWGPIPASTDTWIYWDINLQTGVRTFGQTYLQPQFGPSVPGSPTEDQHFFNTTTKKMFVYQSGGWREVLRVFAAKVNNAVFTALGSGFPSTPFAGTQVGITGEVNAGRIIVDSVGTPIRRVNREFFNTESEFFVNGSPVNTIRLEANVLTATALENVAAFQVVKYTDFGEVELAAYNDISTTVIAMSMESLLVNDTGTLVVQGVVTNPAWSFTTAGAPLWVDDSGELTETDLHVTAVLTHPVGKPPIARVLTPTSIFFDQGMGGKGDQGLPGDIAEADLASTTTFGITKLSVSPVSALNPIAVGDNDPRLAPPAQPLNRIVFGTGSGLTSDVDFTYVPTTGQLYVNTVDGTTVSAPLTASPGAIIMFAGSAGGVNIDGASIELTAGDASGTGSGGEINLSAGTSPSGTPGGFHVFVDGSNQFDIHGDHSWSVDGITGLAGTVLTSNGAGTAPTWETPSSGAAQPDNQIVYGSAGGTSIDSSADFTYDPTTAQLWINTNDGATPITLAAPGTVSIFSAGESTVTGNGADIQLISGGGGTEFGNAGAILTSVSSVGALGVGGGIESFAGNGGTLAGRGGDAVLISGNAVEAGNGGQAILVALAGAGYPNAWGIVAFIDTPAITPTSVPGLTGLYDFDVRLDGVPADPAFTTLTITVAPADTMQDIAVKLQTAIQTFTTAGEVVQAVSNAFKLFNDTADPVIGEAVFSAGTGGNPDLFGAIGTAFGATVVYLSNPVGLSGAGGAVSIRGGDGATRDGAEGGTVSISGGTAGSGYTVLATTTAPDTLVLPGYLVPSFPAGRSITIYIGTNIGNYTVASATFDGVNTTVVTVELTLLSAVDDELIVQDDTTGGSVIIQAGSPQGNGGPGIVRILGAPAAQSVYATPTPTYIAGDVVISGGTVYATNIEATGGSVSISGGNSVTGTAVARAGGSITLTGGEATESSTGGGISLTGGAGGLTGTGGGVSISGGNGGTTSGDGGSVSIFGGPPAFSGDGGGITLQAGDALGTDNDGGAITLSAGDSTGVQPGGDITITAGGSNATNAGDVLITAGTATSTGIAGNVIINGGVHATTGDGGGILILAGDAVGGGNNQGAAVSIASGSSTGIASGGVLDLTAGDGGATGQGGHITLKGGAGNGGSQDGSVVIGRGTTSTTRVGDFLYVPTSAGAPTGGAGVIANFAPLVYDTSNDTLYFYNSGWVPVAGAPAPIAGMVVGTPPPSGIILNFVAASAFTVPDDFAGSQAKAQTAATASSTFDVKRNGTTFGTINFAAASAIGTFTTSAGAEAFAIGDILTIVAPVIIDASLADIGITIVIT